jgi:hypothetical protein
MYKRMTLHEGDSSLRSEDNLKSVAVQVYALPLPVCMSVYVSPLCICRPGSLPYFEAIPYFGSADFVGGFSDGSEIRT